MQTYAYGFPRIGKNREYKKSIEAFWKGEFTDSELSDAITRIEEERINIYKQYVDSFPIGETTLYDHILDAAILFGLYQCNNLNDYYNLCRGKNALSMKKWFNTNYHYLVPEFSENSSPACLKLNPLKHKEFYSLSSSGLRFLIGPFTFLKLSKGIPQKYFPDYLIHIAELYADLIRDFPDVHIEEPAFVMDLCEPDIRMIKQAYTIIGAENPNIHLITYYDTVDFLRTLYDLPIKAIALDFVNSRENLKKIKQYGFPSDKILIAGIVNGLNVWKNNLQDSLVLLNELSQYADNIIISNAAPLFHLPITINGEELPEKLTRNLAFAEEKLKELNVIADFYEKIQRKDYFSKTSNISSNSPANENNIHQQPSSMNDVYRTPLYKERINIQKKILNLPLFPTTTIGSFPQTPEIRKKRKQFYSGEISELEYDTFIRNKIKELVQFQEDIGLDVLVHGEFERTDMVEFFAKQLEGIVTTKKGWVISYGTRVYRPPIIYSDISRPRPMTLKEITYAQNLTSKPVKGMLTGPVTIIAWSYVREDIPLSQVACQIARCIREEIKDYEKKGIKIIQIDEAAFREKAPVKKRFWPEYFKWAVNSFNLCCTEVNPETQIHTHMCYSEFKEIIDYINRMDFDVITIEMSRSKSDCMKAFSDINFEKQIGPGVWDIHSPAIPDINEMESVIQQALKIFPKENIWINPDCGLKTRNWPETKASLINMITVAKNLRNKYCISSADKVAR